MFAKIFNQIFDSSIAEDFTVRHVFMDLLVLADSEGVIDMTAEAISRRTNVPLETVALALEELAKPDPHSRSKQDQGRRIRLLDGHRKWGWRIVNYPQYRAIIDDEARRSYFRNYRRAARASAKKCSVPAKSATDVAASDQECKTGDGQQKENVQSVQGCLEQFKKVTQAEGEAEAEGVLSLTRARADESLPLVAQKSTPSLSEVLAAAKNMGVLPEVAEIFYNDCESRELSNNGKWTNRDKTEIAKWQHAMKAFAGRWQSNVAQRMQARQSKPPARGSVQ